MHDITDNNFENEVLNEKKMPVLVDFWAEWCGPCKMFLPTVIEVSHSMSGKIKFCKMNIDDSPDTPSKYNIRTIPTLLLFKEGNLVATKVGSCSKENLEDWLESHL